MLYLPYKVKIQSDISGIPRCSDRKNNDIFSTPGGLRNSITLGNFDHIRHGGAQISQKNDTLAYFSKNDPWAPRSCSAKS